MTEGRKLTENDICKAAKKASKHAYAPYSGFPVGAAVETDVGICTGCNVENASYGLTVCAERNAIFKAVSKGAKKVSRVAVYNQKKIPIPCGACLQVLSEFAAGNCEIFVVTDRRKNKMMLKDLLPRPF